MIEYSLTAFEIHPVTVDVGLSLPLVPREHTANCSYIKRDCQAGRPLIMAGRCLTQVRPWSSSMFGIADGPRLHEHFV
jgi:hypothetical protein